MAGQLGCLVGKLQRHISTVPVPAKWMGQAPATTLNSWSSHSFFIHLPLGYLCLSVWGCICVHVNIREPGRRQKERTKSKCAHLYMHVTHCHCVLLIKVGRQACFSGLQESNYKPFVILHILSQSQLPVEGWNRTGILQLRCDAGHMLDMLIFVHLNSKWATK